MLNDKRTYDYNETYQIEKRKTCENGTDDFVVQAEARTTDTNE